MPSTETITVTIPDKDEQLSPDHPDQTGVKDRVEISDAVLEKLALLLRPPLASGPSTWGPLIVGVLAAIGAPVGVFFTLQQKGKSDNQSGVVAAYSVGFRAHLQRRQRGSGAWMERARYTDPL